MVMCLIVCKSVLLWVKCCTLHNVQCASQRQTCGTRTEYKQLNLFDSHCSASRSWRCGIRFRGDMLTFNEWTDMNCCGLIEQSVYMFVEICYKSAYSAIRVRVRRNNSIVVQHLTI